MRTSAQPIQGVGWVGWGLGAGGGDGHGYQVPRGWGGVGLDTGRLPGDTGR